MQNERSLAGVWRLLDLSSSSGAVFTGQTHLVVREGELWEIWRDQVLYDDAPNPVRPFSLAWAGRDGALRIELVGRPPKCGVVRLDGDQLQIRWGSVAGNPPLGFDDVAGHMSSLERVVGPEAEARSEPPVRLPRATRAHPRLGPLTRDDNLGWWQGQVTVAGRPVDLAVEAPPDVRDGILDQVAERVGALDLADIRTYAADHLFPLYDDVWRRGEGPDVDRAGFVSLLALRSLTFDPPERGCGMSVWFDDGGLFWGHSVLVVLDAKLRPIDAQMT